jgi:hypothetical protein
MCLQGIDYLKAREIIDRPSKELTRSEYEFLKEMHYPVDQLKYAIKENVPS